MINNFKKYTRNLYSRLLFFETNDLNLESLVQILKKFNIPVEYLDLNSCTGILEITQKITQFIDETFCKLINYIPNEILKKYFKKTATSNFLEEYNLIQSIKYLQAITSLPSTEPNPITEPSPSIELNSSTELNPIKEEQDLQPTIAEENPEEQRAAESYTRFYNGSPIVYREDLSTICLTTYFDEQSHQYIVIKGHHKDPIEGIDLPYSNYVKRKKIRESKELPKSTHNINRNLDKLILSYGKTKEFNVPKSVFLKNRSDIKKRLFPFDEINTDELINLRYFMWCKILNTEEDVNQFLYEREYERIDWDVFELFGFTKTQENKFLVTHRFFRAVEKQKRQVTENIFAINII